jgi:hypothetical protein
MRVVDWMRDNGNRQEVDATRDSAAGPRLDPPHPARFRFGADFTEMR